MGVGFFPPGPESALQSSVGWDISDSSPLATDDVRQIARGKGSRVLLYRSENRPLDKA
ncbi:hypothetical protein GGR40_003875 [Novosphingobium gossypii]